jgi:shikimate 5-dehydrogenase
VSLLFILQKYFRLEFYTFVNRVKTENGFYFISSIDFIKTCLVNHLRSVDLQKGKQQSVLVLGAGLCPPPLVKYLGEHGFRVILASRTLEAAKKLIDGVKNAEAKGLLR